MLTVAKQFLMRQLARGRGTRKAVAVALVSVLPVVACADASSSADPIGPTLRAASITDAAVPGTARSTASNARDQLDLVARAIARALSRPEVRRAVRDAMRDSRVNEHKLELQPYLADPRGGQLRDAMLAEGGLTAGALDAALTALPTLDFYLPFSHQRRTWRAEANIAVAGTLSQVRGVLPAYRASGQLVAIGATPGDERTTILLLHPAEPKAWRDNPQPLGPGEVIEDGDEGQIATRRLAPGESVLDPAPPRRATPQFAADGVAGSVWVYDIAAVYACDYTCQIPGFPGGDALEIEFKTWINNVEQKQPLFGYPQNIRDAAHTTGFTGLRIRTNRPSSSQWIALHVMEIDNGGDDLWIESFIQGSQFPSGLRSGGGIRCQQGSLTYHAWDCVNQLWREFNVRYELR